MNDLQLIVSDLDGTFVNTEKQVGPINRRAILLAAELGIPTVFATGRPAEWLHPLDGLHQAEPWAVTNNGALTLRLATREIVRAAELPKQLTIEVAEQIRAELGDKAAFAVEYVERWGAEPNYGVRGHFVEADYIGTLPELMDKGQGLKMLVRGYGVPTNELAALVAPIVGDRLTMTFSFDTADGLMEITDAGVSKASAVKEIMADLGIDPAAAVGFGDMPNDMTMLKLVGMPFRMEHCHASLVEAGFPSAGDNNDCGVGRTVLRLLGRHAEA